MDDFQRAVRAAVYTAFRDTTRPPPRDDVAAELGAPRETVVAALRALADEHILVLMPDGETIWMAHPFSGVASDVVAAVGAKHWFATHGIRRVSVLARAKNESAVRLYQRCGFVPARSEVLFHKWYKT